MNSPPRTRVGKDVIVTMVVILAMLALVAIYANVQRWRRDKIAHVIIIPAASPTPAR